VLQARRPDLNFDDTPAMWSPYVEVAMVLNAGGALAPAIEPYLNRVMSEAARRLGHDHGELKATIKAMVRQETEHFKLHAAFNAALYRQGHGALEPVVTAVQLDLNRQFRDRSFAFNLAWCVAFETFTLYLGQFLFGPGDVWLAGADSRAADLWRWHLAEEYEHRSVCHDAYAALVGDYWLRTRMLAHVHRQVQDYRRRALTALTDVRPAAFTRAMTAFVLPRLILTLSPLYHPALVKPPPGAMEALETYAAA
jgi:predicted metal-dependent hydrolase